MIHAKFYKLFYKQKTFSQNVRKNEAVWHGPDDRYKIRKKSN